MIEIPAGPFLFGSSLEERRTYYAQPTEPTQRTETTAAFAIGKYEVTNREFACFLADGGYQNQTYWTEEGWALKERFGWTQPRKWHDSAYRRWETQPVAALSRHEAEAYCRWLNAKTGKAYRLPTEKEWEKAARGTDGRIFPWGNSWEPTFCNWLPDENNDRFPDASIDGFIYTAPVTDFAEGKSPYGCMNMAGNVLEWCADPLVYRGTSYAVYRGGSFNSGEIRFLRCAWRGGTRPEIGHVYWGIIGFRLAEGR
ncbi:MAG: SUMF1/EgtB/PvdO family nonheme iron enzyme [bacterium]|jgi:formylglycine-generating enzyme required for sulfatase activity|nr:SUMF1/EgtB/PvdO family nonheme iron enzyme [bacterium]